MGDYFLADSHFHSAVTQCTSSLSCLFNGSLALSRTFSKIPEPKRIDYVRSMLLVLASPLGYPNELLKYSARSRKRAKTTEFTEGTELVYSSIRYALKGKPLCRNGFLAIVQLSSTTLHRHVSQIAPYMEFEPYVTERGAHMIGKTSVHTTIAVAFLRRYGDLHGLPCPRGSVDSDEDFRRYLPTGYLKKDVYESYKSGWESLRTGTESSFSYITPTCTHLSIKIFLRAWIIHYSRLRIAD